MNKHIKKLFLRVLLFIEIMLFGFAYIFGANGIYKLKTLANENNALENDIKNLKSEIQLIENEMNEWNSDTFYKEQLAREKLQLARENEKIYYIE